MLVNFNPTATSYKKQKTTFGNERSANLLKNTIQAALDTNAPKLKITTEQALQKLETAIGHEDKAGKSILKRFKIQLLDKK